MALWKSAVLVLASVAAAATASAQVFPGTGVGPIPDGLAGTPPQYGPPLVVSFAVSGLVSNVSTVGVDITLTHTWVGDLDVVLAAPGGAPSLAPVSHVGVMAAGAFGDSSNYNGLYGFGDGSSAANIWTVATAAACGSACDVTPAVYRPTAGGGPGQTNPPPFTSLGAVFGGLTPALANGTWTLTFRDAAQADVGAVTAANLYIDTPVPVELQSFAIE